MGPRLFGTSLETLLKVKNITKILNFHNQCLFEGSVNAVWHDVKLLDA